MKRIIALLLAVMMFASLCAGCRNASDQVTELTPATSDPGADDLTPETPSPEPTASVTVTPEPTVSPTAAPEPTVSPTDAPLTDVPEPTEDPTKEEALRIAELHGLSEADIRGEYALLVRFGETVDQNGKLGDYRDFLYRIFPVVAKNKEILDEDRFFYRLGTLSIGIATIVTNNNGQYFGN